MLSLFRRIKEKIIFEFTKLYSFVFCVRYLSFKEAKLCPILISPKVRIGHIPRGSIKIRQPLRKYMIQIGLHSGSEGLPCHSNGFLSIGVGGVVAFGGSAIISEGCGIRVDSGVLTIGSQFYCNKNCFIRITCNANIGNDCMFGWNVKLNTTDGHPVIFNGKEKQSEGSITIGNHVWIGSDTAVTKNAQIPDDSLICQNSLVNKKFTCKNSLIGGIPAKIIADGYNWVR